MTKQNGSLRPGQTLLPHQLFIALSSPSIVIDTCAAKQPADDGGGFRVIPVPLPTGLSHTRADRSA